MVYFKEFIEGKSNKEIADFFVKNFRTTEDEVEQDYMALLDKVQLLLG